MKKRDEINPFTAIAQSDGGAISQLYDRYRGEFVAFARGEFSLREYDAVEIYQESFIALYENITNGKLTRLTASLKSYLFQIGRHKMLNKHRNEAGRRSVDLTEAITERSREWDLREQITYELVQQMQEPCNTVLTLYYWEELTMEQIARKMNYLGAQVAKNRKSLCMRKLKTTLYKRFVAEGLL